MITDEKIISRFMAKVVRGGDGECWGWLASVSVDGYGNFGFTQEGRKGRMTGAHRVSWLIFKGEIPDGLEVLHTCDNPPCTNPSHLFIGTQVDNVKDRDSKRRGRWAYGEQGNTNLKEPDILRIRELCASGVRHQMVADEFKISLVTVSRIKLGKLWKHVDGAIIGSYTHGERLHCSKLNDEKVREIRRSDLPQKELAAMFGVGVPTISVVQSGKTWKHVQD